MNDRHDIGNDLAAIVGYAEMLGSTQLTTEQQLYVNEILVQARGASKRLESMAWQPEPDDIVRLLSQWRSDCIPVDSNIDENLTCSACGALMKAGHRALLLIDASQPIPPEMLGYSLTPGFVTDRVQAQDGSSIGIDQIVRALHNAGGHLHLRTTHHETRLLVTFPAEETTRP